MVLWLRVGELFARALMIGKLNSRFNMVRTTALMASDEPGE